MASPADSPRGMFHNLGGHGLPRGEPGGCMVRTVDLPLEPELLQLLCRRSRKRLREIQERCQLVNARIDRSNACLTVTGNEAAIRATRSQLDALCGPRKQVPQAFWAELMRTRTMTQPPSQIHVVSLQEATGCRVHIERGVCEVRLFGPRESVAKAWDMIDQLTSHVGEGFLSTENSVVEFPTQLLQALAMHFEVTLLLEEKGVTVLGLPHKISVALEELQFYMSGAKPIPVDLLQAQADAEAAAQQSTMQGGKAVPPKPPQVPPTAPLGATGAGRGGPLQQQWQPAPPAGGGGGPVHPHGSAHHQNGSFCPMCGCGQFCGCCGAEVVRMKFDRGEAMPWMQQNQQQQNQQQQQQQVVFMPYNGGGGNVPMGQPMQQIYMMQPSSAPGPTASNNGAMVEGQTYMVPAAWVMQSCVMPPSDREAELNGRRGPVMESKQQSTAYPTASLSSLPTVGYSSSIDSLDMQQPMDSSPHRFGVGA